MLWVAQVALFVHVYLGFRAPHADLYPRFIAYKLATHANALLTNLAIPRLSAASPSTTALALC